MKQINVPVSEDVYAAAKMGAAAAGIPMKDWVAQAIINFSTGAPVLRIPSIPEGGTSGQILVADSKAKDGMKWADPETVELTIDPNQDFGA